MFPGAALYAGLIAVALADIAGVSAGRLGVAPYDVLRGLLPLVLMACVAGGLYFADRRFTPLLPEQSREEGRQYFERAQAFLCGVIFIRLAWIVLPLYNHLLMSLPFPMQDAWLAAMDRALHLDWTAYFNFVAARPWLARLTEQIYMLFSPASVIVLFCLIATGYIRRAEFFILMFAVSAFICITVGAFFPAYGAVAWLAADPHMFRNFHEMPGVYHVPYLDLLKSGQSFGLDINSLPGLVAFPSFHTAGGIVMARACRGTPLFGSVTLYAAAMIATTPVAGGHYFIDLIAGALVAVIVILGCERLARYRPDEAAP